MDNSGKEKEAIQLMADADKKVKSSGSFLGGMFGGWAAALRQTLLAYMYTLACPYI